MTFDNNVVKAESGTKLQKLIQEAIKQNLSGLEFLIGIPGTVGGGVAGNVGTPKEWINKSIISVEILDENDKVITLVKNECDFAYRCSRFKSNDKEVILSANFQLSKVNPQEIKIKVKEYQNKRSHQPVQESCAGSIFKNPEGKKVWELIEEIGFRGKQIGGAKVSEQHTNFITNTGQAKAEDIIILISYIKQQVRNKFGIQLQEEIKYIGF